MPIVRVRVICGWKAPEEGVRKHGGKRLPECRAEVGYVFVFAGMLRFVGLQVERGIRVKGVQSVAEEDEEEYGTKEEEEDLEEWCEEA